MKTSFSLAGLLLVLVFVSFIDSPNSSGDTGKSISYSSSNNETEEVSAQEKTVTPFSSLELVLEETEVVDGDVVETYREYEIYKDENGNVVKRVPTSNYNYLRFEK